MAPTEGRNESSIFEGWENWQIALAVGAPVCLGLAGLWYYNRAKKSKSSGDESSKMKPPTNEKVKTSGSPKVTSGSQQENENKDTPLGKAQEFKNTGNKNFKQGKYDEAIKCYTQALEVCPAEHTTEISTFYANRAAAYEKLKNPKQVLENCTEAIRLNGKYTKALSRRANAAEQLGDLQLSLEDVTAVCILEGFQNQSTLQMADRVLKNLGKSKAKEALKNKKPGMPSKHFLKSYFASFTKDPIQGLFKNSKEEKQSNIPGQSDEEEKILNVSEPSGAGDQPDVVKEEPVSSDSDSSFTKACEKLEAGEYEEVIPLCRKEISVSPQTHHCQLALLLRGTMFCLTAQSDQAFMDLDQLLNTDNLDKKIKVNALIKRGSLYITKEQQTEGLADFAHAVRIDPKNSDIYHHRGHVRIYEPRHMKTYLKAIATIMDPDEPAHPRSLIRIHAVRFQTLYMLQNLQANSMDPDETARKRRLIWIHAGRNRLKQNIQLDRLEDAIKDFESSISLNPNFPNSYIQKSYAEHRRAAAEQSTMKLEKAIKSYEDTLKRFPENADGHALYAQALCDLGRFDDADNEFETAIKLEPDNANTLVHRALLKLQWKQNIEEPVALIKQAIDLDEKCEYAYEILGTIEVQRGDMVNAVSLFEKAIDLCRTETEMSHLFSLLHAAKAQLKAAQTLGIPLPSNFSPM